MSEKKYYDKIYLALNGYDKTLMTDRYPEMRTKMQTIINEWKIENIYDITELYPEDKLLFFDIETTGLSRTKNTVYMIGIGKIEGETFTVTQYFNDDGKSEKELVKAFFNDLSTVKYLVNYNGNTFDIPFLEAKAVLYDIESKTDTIESVDIYKLMVKHKKYFSLPDLKQKTVELFLGIQRDDLYDGGMLIKVYNDFLKTNDAGLKELLLLHNYEDIIGLLKLCNLFPYFKCFNKDFKVTDYVLNEDGLKINCLLDSKVFTPLSIKNDLYYLTISDNELKLFFPAEKGVFKHFYSDYKNYYYLPLEDTAIHKSVAEYVDKEHRVKATKNNCYTKKEGYFIPQLNPVIEPVFKKEAGDSICYFSSDTSIDINQVMSLVTNI